MRLSEIADYLGISLQGPDQEITGVNTLADAASSEISFLANAKYTAQLQTTQAAAVLVTEEHAAKHATSLISDNPYLDFARTVQLFAKAQGSFEGQSTQAAIHPDASIHPTAILYPFVTVGKGTVIEAGVTLFSGTYVGENCHIGAESILYPNCSLMAGTQVGKRCILHAGVVLGSDGFGFAQATNRMTKFPQIGRTVLEDDVEIGANTTIDRAALGETRVGAGTKIDNLVQLGHNVRTGRNCILVAQVGIAGSTVLGDQVILAGQVGVGGHVHIGDKCRVGAKSGVAKNLEPGQDVSGIPAMPHTTFLRNAAATEKLPELRRRLSRLEKQVQTLQKELDQ